MKLYQVQHINEPHNENAVFGMELRFLHQLCPMSGKLTEAGRQPDEWQNVRRLTNNLFLAWDNKNPVEGSVYLGDFYAPQQEQNMEVQPTEGPAAT